MKLKNITKILLSLLLVLIVTPIIIGLTNNIPISQNLYFDQQKNFDGYVNYKFFKNLSTCHPYATPTNINAPLGFPTGYYKTQIAGVSNNKCVVRNYRKNKASETWKLSEEFQLHIDYSKNLGLLITREIKNPNERLTHLKKCCELNKRPSDACVNLQNGTDKNNYFYHINLGLAKYQTYPYTYSQQIPIQNKTFYTNK